MLGTRSSAARRRLTSWKMTARSSKGAPVERGQLSLKLKELGVQGGSQESANLTAMSCPFPVAMPTPGSVYVCCPTG